MSSRMDRYKNREENLENTMYGRSNKNKSLYNNMDYDVFSSNETIIDTSNEIDITKLKQIINSREEYKKANSYRNILEDKKINDNDYIKDYNNIDYEQKDYDINSLLDKVKLEKHETENNKSRRLINTQYDILSKLDVKSKGNVSTIPDKDEDDKLQQLIDDIVKKEENDEVLDLFEDLKGEDTVVTQGFKDENNILPAYNEENNKKETKTIDDFLDDSIVFDDDDFDDFKNIEKNSKSSTLLKVIIFVLIVVICTVLIFVLDSMYHFIPF